MIKKLLYVLLFFTLGTSVYGTHLVGGSLGYEYVGQFGGNYRYNVILTVYNNCDGLSNIPLPVATQDIGVYQQDISNDPMGGGSKNLIQLVTLNLVDSNEVSPPIASGCPVGQSVCIFKGVYEGTIDVPLNFEGYHLYFENFARNGAITNLLNPGGTVMAFHAYIAPPLIQNSSPVFVDDPVPFLCVNDTVSILNSAIDPDGDQLIFSFVEPMAGPNGGFGPMPNPLAWPIAPINYDAGYSVAQPFGAGGYSFIDGSTGLTEYMAPNTGNYVVAVEIREFRNGNLIGVSRRDLQLLVINCPPNPPPNLAATGGSGTTKYTLEECDTLSFPVTFTDPNGDSLFLSTSGQIFDPLVVNPAATIDSLVIGDSTVTANFNWQTSCGTAQALPYLFTVSTTDNGCPPKTTNIVYEVTVNPPTPPDSISGPPIICENSTETYSVDSINGFTYTWTVTNGTLLSGQGSSSINVNWANVGVGTVSVQAFSSCGCPAAVVDTAVTILAVPLVDAGLDSNICSGDTLQIGGSPTGQLGTTASWTPATNISNSTASNPLVWPSSTTPYIVTVDNGTCTSMDTITVSVGSATIAAGVDTSICLGDTTQLSAVGGGTYSWSPSIGLSDTTISNPLAFPIVTTNYIVTITDTLGCVGIDTLLVNVDTIPVITMSPDTSVCFGDSIQISASGGASFLWTPGATLSDSTIGSPNAFPTTTTTYYVDVLNSVACFSQDSVTVTVNLLPTIVTNNDTAICLGNCVQLNASGGQAYEWTPSAGLSDTTIVNPVACPLITTDYIVTGTDTNTCSNTDTVTIVVNALPTVDAGLAQPLCIGDSLTIGGAPTGPNGAAYSWSPSATIVDDTLANPTVFPIITTTYQVIVTDTNGCIDSSTVDITVNSLPIVDAGVDSAICIGSSITLGGAPTGPLNSSYTWSPSVSLDDDTLSNPLATPTITPTEYIVIVNDTNGCLNSDSVTISLNALPTVDAGIDTSVCIGDSIVIGGAPTGPNGATYLWTPPASLDDDTLANPTVFPTVLTNYLVTVTDTNGCIDTASVNVAVNLLPTINAGTDVWVCTGDSIQLNATGGLTYLWSPSQGLSDTTIFDPIVNSLVTATYIVEGFDINGCSDVDTILVTVNDDVPIDPGVDTTICIGDSIQLGGAPTSPVGTTYSWFPNTSLDDDTLANPTAFPTTTTTYYIVATNDTCTEIDSVTIFVNQAPVTNLGTDTAICFGDSVQLNATGGVTYIWSPGNSLTDSTIFNPIAFPTDTTEYIALITDTNGCSAFDSVIVNVNPLPVISAGLITNVCSGDSVQLNATGGVNYTWSPGSSLTDSTIANPLAYPTLNTLYTVVGIDTEGCSNSDTVTVVVNSLVVVDLSDTVVCIGDSLQLQVNGPVGASYLWSPGTSLSSTTVSNPTTTTQATITYFVTVTDTNGCTDTTSITVVAEPAPTASFTQESTPVCDGISVEFTNSSVGALSYLWDFGDGEQSVEVSPTHVFVYGGSYTTILTALGVGTCSDTASFSFDTGNFEDYFSPIPPSVFTPNGDGLNDLFKIDLPDGIGNCTDLQIFNRWGIKIYDSFSQNGGWDGRTTAGIEVPDGTYFFVLEINGMVKKGSITLVR